MIEEHSNLKGRVGRPRGATNAATLNARRAIAEFIDDNVDRLNGWLIAIAEGEKNENGEYLRKPDPKSAFDCFMSVCEYHIPKLQRAEHIKKMEKKLTVEILTVTKEEQGMLIANNALPIIENNIIEAEYSEAETNQS
jgi:hypothetical protein